MIGGRDDEERRMLDSADSLNAFVKFFEILRFAPHENRLQTVVVVQVLVL